MHLARALLVLGLAATTASADYWETAGIGTPFVNKTAAAFFTAYPKAAATLRGKSVDEHVIPGGAPCWDEYDPDLGGQSSYFASPDNAKLVIVSTVKLTATIAKALKLAADADADAVAIVVVLDGPTGTMWAARIEGTACGLAPDSQGVWSSDGKYLLAINEFGGKAGTDGTHTILVDLAAKKVRMDGTLTIAEWREQPVYSDLAVTGPTKITVCVTRPAAAKAAPMQYRFEGETVLTTKLGPCPIAKPAKPTDVKPADTKAPAKPADAKAPAKPADAKALAKPADAPAPAPAKPAEAKPAPAKPADAKAPAKPADAKPAKPATAP